MNIFIRSDLVVTGTNSEMADMSNPRGEIVEEAFFLVAEHSDGSRWAHNYTSTDLDTIERLERRAMSAELNLRANWHEIEPAYGSPAYTAGGWEERALDLERREG